MATLYDVFPNDHIAKISEELKKIEAIQAPDWAKFVKTGVHKERAPVEKDWWHTRAAAVLRKVAIMGPIGVSKLRTKYGGKKRMGHRMPHFKKGSGSVIRKVLQQLEKAELIAFKDVRGHKGRVVTSKGLSLLDKTANEIVKSMEKPKKSSSKKEEPKKEVPKVEAKEAPKQIEGEEKKKVEVEPKELIEESS